MGFFEILLIFIVILLVVGPEQIPDAVSSTALAIGRLKRSFNRAFQEVEEQVGLDEIRSQLNQELVMQNIDKIRSDVSEIDRKISAGEEAMPWTADEYEALKVQEK